MCYYVNSSESPSIVNPVATISEVDLSAASPHWHCTRLGGGDAPGFLSALLKSVKWLSKLPLPEP